MNRIVKRILIISGIAIGAVVLSAGGYVAYVLLSYSRIGDAAIEVDSKSPNETVKVGQTYKALSYNIGFGAYSQDYTFFLDTGYDEDGNETCGYYSKGRNKSEVMFNTTGAIAASVEENPDFLFFQEVDTNSTRSYKINQDALIQEAFPSYDHTHAVNYHSPFLPYPLYDMHGYTGAGLTTLANFKIRSAERKEYTVSEGFDKFFDLDRCFSFSVIDVENGKKLYIINSHMSAYDAGGSVRATQLKELSDFLEASRGSGNYVLVGGDFNHDLLTYNPEYDYSSTNRPFGETKKDPDWVHYMFEEDGSCPLPDSFRVIASDNTPSCRNNDIEWIPGKTYTTVIDGFIVSDNIEVVSRKNILTKNGKKGLDGFAFSDHDPAMMEFKLK